MLGLGLGGAGGGSASGGTAGRSIQGWPESVTGSSHRAPGSAAWGAVGRGSCAQPAPADDPFIHGAVPGLVGGSSPHAPLGAWDGCGADPLPAHGPVGSSGCPALARFGGGGSSGRPAAGPLGRGTGGSSGPAWPDPLARGGAGGWAVPFPSVHPAPGAAGRPGGAPAAGRIAGRPLGAGSGQPAVRPWGEGAPDWSAHPPEGWSASGPGAGSGMPWANDSSSSASISGQETAGSSRQELSG